MDMIVLWIFDMNNLATLITILGLPVVIVQLFYSIHRDKVERSLRLIDRYNRDYLRLKISEGILFRILKPESDPDATMEIINNKTEIKYFLQELARHWDGELISKNIITSHIGHHLIYVFDTIKDDIDRWRKAFDDPKYMLRVELMVDEIRNPQQDFNEFLRTLSN